MTPLAIGASFIEFQARWNVYSSQVWLSDAQVTGGCYGQRLPDGRVVGASRTNYVGTPSLGQIYPVWLTNTVCGQYYIDFSGDIQMSGGYAGIRIHRGGNSWRLAISIGDY